MEYFIWNADPILFSFGGIRIFWYGLLFATPIVLGTELVKWIHKREGKDVALVDTVFLYTFFGIVLGARLGHCLFYDPAFYLANPMKILAVWEGGLASHGGGIGITIGLFIYASKHKINFLWLIDRMTMPTALFAFFVRMGNFMNSEIIGRQTDVPWAIILARIDNLPRHPAQIYEAIAYFFIFIMLVTIYKTSKKLKSGFLLGLFFTSVFTARFLIEFIKQRQASYESEFFLNTGQMLSIPFLIIGIGLIIYSIKKK